MAQSWAYLAKWKGYRTSPEFALSIDGDGAISQITWESIEPAGTSIKVETNVSFNGGYDWNGWKPAVKDGSIPDFLLDESYHNVKLKYRVIEETTDETKTPELISVSFTLEPIISFDNKGDVNIKPEIWIEKVGNGNFSITNATTSQVFSFTGLLDQETVYVDNEQEYIETDLAATYRYSNHNDQFLYLVAGKNILRIAGNAKIQFRHQFKLLQG